MARNAKHPCRSSNCSTLLDKPGLCAVHADQAVDRKDEYKRRKQVVTEEYKERNRFYQRSAWKKLRAAQLRIEPLCRKCREIGKLVEATVVDHVIPVTAGGAELELSNLQSLCVEHHNAKTNSERHII
jgi:5-methylcytosine-specific restriction endonuclease McrA